MSASLQSAPPGARGRQSQAGEKRGGGGLCVVGGEELAVGDKFLEDDAGEVVGAGDAA